MQGLRRERDRERVCKDSGEREDKKGGGGECPSLTKS